MVLSPTMPLTVADFDALTELPENAEKRFELYHGEAIEVDRPSPLHAIIVAILTRFLGNFVATAQSGYVIGDGCLFYLPNGDVFIPDASYVSFARQPALPARFSIAPDLAIEVVSPSNRHREILNKVESYLMCGTVLVWVVYPEEQIIDSYQHGENGTFILRKHTTADTLNGDLVLPGFRLSVKDVFPPQP